MRRLPLLLLTLALAACARERPRAAAAKPVAPKREAPAKEWESLPARDAYAGSAACKECHEKNYDAWSHDWHARALAKAANGAAVGRFDHAHFRGASSEAWMSRRGDAYVMRTKDRDGRLGDYDVRWLIGGKRMQDTVTVMPDGRWQVLPVYFHVTGGGAWVDYNEAKQGAVTPDHPFFWTNFRRTANKECLDCHATGLDLRYDRAAATWTTRFADAGVACEACHGPGARHAETKEKRDIVHPGHIDKSLALAICARCHGVREPLFPLLDAKDQFRPGQRYEDRYQALVVVDGTQRSGEYFADGRPSSSTFEYQALLQSRCYRDGGATCLTCHTAPHKEHGDDELKSAAHDTADETCRGCHAAVFAQGAAHTHHAGNAGASCSGCHMPKLLSGVLDRFADHTLDVPNPANTSRHGVPNACGVCHATKSSDDLQRTMLTWWPQTAARQARRARLADAIDEQTSSASLPSLAAVVADAHEAPTLRGAAALLLGQRFPAQTSAVLVPQLHDQDDVVRTRVIESLGYAQARDAADAVASLLDDRSLAVRHAAALVLASFHDPRGETAVAKLANDADTHALFRPHVVLAVAAANRGDLETARREIDAAIALAPYASDALVFRADLDVRRGDVKAARGELTEALRFDPRHRGALGRLRALSGGGPGAAAAPH
jgi:hypothetical protein